MNSCYNKVGIEFNINLIEFMVYDFMETSTLWLIITYKEVKYIVIIYGVHRADFFMFSNS